MFFLDYCDTLAPAIRIIKAIINIIRWGIPILLIVFGTIDLAKAVVAGKEDEMKKAQNTFIKRLIYAIAVFLVVTLVSFVMGIVSKNANGDDTAISCWTDTNVIYK
ncbi:MAG: hypothetical protein IJI49_00570 [Bacilli bacterium]|nr:hypothetical protein [Bacilli bacterium]